MMINGATTLCFILVYLRCVVTLSDFTCSSYPVAHNSDIVWNWTSIDAMTSYTRISHTSHIFSKIVSSPRLIIVGGIENEFAQPVVTNCVLVYDLVSKKWLTASDIVYPLESLSYASPASRSMHSSFETNGIGYLFGGLQKANANDAWRFCFDSSASTMIWDQLKSKGFLPTPRAGHTFVQVYENSSSIGAILFGGTEDVGETNDAYLAIISKPNSGCACCDRKPQISWSQLDITTSISPSPRAHHVSAAVSSALFSSQTQCIVVYGGKNTKQNTIFDDLWRLCPSSNASNNAAVSNAIEFQQFTWEKLSFVGRTPGGRFGHAITLIDTNRFLVAGGSSTFPSDFLGDAWELNLDAAQWIQIKFTDDMKPRRAHSISYLQDRLYLFGGRNRYGAMLSNVESSLYLSPSCPAGNRIMFCELTGKYMCVPCPAGYYLQQGSATCTICQPGSFSLEGSSQCTQCPEGTYNPYPGSTSKNQCLLCPAGTYSTALGAIADTTCVSCPEGTFSSELGATLCANCPPGSVSASGSIACSLCDSGQFSKERSSKCVECSAGTFSPSKGSNTCLVCPQGYYSNASSAGCSPCPLNTYSVSLGSSFSGCVSCEPYSYTTRPGQSRCIKCSSGSYFDESSTTCIECSPGSFSSDFTEGKCQLCPKGFFQPGFGNQECNKCPNGAFTDSIGSTSILDCKRCATGMYYDGNQCTLCTSGTYLSVSQDECSTCPLGTYSSSGFCPKCPPMTYTESRGKSNCDSCPKDSYSQFGFRRCIQCSSTSNICPFGKNGLECSGNGQCSFGGCKCIEGWTSTDCGEVDQDKLSAAQATPNCAVNDHCRGVLSISNPQLDTFKHQGSISIKISRSGGLQNEISAIIHFNRGNISLGVASSIFPMPITLGHLEMSKAYLVPIPIPSTGCQYGVLELQNLIVDDLLSSNISTDGGQWTFYMDSMGGLVDLSLQTPLYQSLEWSIRADTSVIETIEVPLSRNLATNLRLEPCQLQDSLLSQTINVLFWIPQISSSIGFCEVSPGILAILQKSYKSVHFGLLPSDLTSTTPTFYIEEDIADFISSVEQQCFVTPNNPLNLRLLSGALKKVRWTSNARRFLVVISNNPSISYTLNDIVQLQDTFMDQNILPNFLVAVGKDEKYVDMLKNMQFGTLKVFSRPDELPVKLNESFLENDNATPFVFTLMDTNQLVDSLVVLPPAAPYSLPSLSVLLRTLSDNYVPTSSIRIVILGISYIILSPQQAGESCITAQIPRQLDELSMDAFSGWIGSFEGVNEIKEEWDVVSPNRDQMLLQVQQDYTLSRTLRNSVMSLQKLSPGNIQMKKYLDGSIFSKGVPFVLRAFNKKLDPKTKCKLQVNVFSTGNDYGTTACQITFDSTSRSWRYSWSRFVVESDVSSGEVLLDCEVVDVGKELYWAGIGFFVEPEFACQCPKGYYFQIQPLRTGEGECIRCPAGYYCAGSMIRRCPLGMFSFGKAEKCEVCRNGWICVDGLASLCNPGTYTSENSTCLPCPEGYSCRNGKKFICPVGTFSIGSASECGSCPPGTFSSTEGSSTCSFCDIQKTSSYQRDHCVSCITGEKSLKGQHPCDSCVDI